MTESQIYSLGIRDGIAGVLMEAKYENIKLPTVAKDYQEKFGEHPALEWHYEKTSKTN